MRKAFFYVALVAVCALLAGCSAEVRREPQVLNLTPAFKPAKFKSAAVFNFQLMDGFKGEGPALADYSADSLIKNRVVEEVERIGQFIIDPAQAASLARREMKQLAVVGSIDEYTYGGLSTESRVAVTLTVVEAATGKVLASLRGALSEPPKRAREMFFYLDSGGPAPLPMHLARRLIDALTGELLVKPPPKVAPKPVAKPAPKQAPVSAHDTARMAAPEKPSALPPPPPPAPEPATPASGQPHDTQSEPPPNQENPSK